MQHVKSEQSIDIKVITPISEARRQLEICNACRYCEGYCSVFPSVHRQRSFTDADVQQLANLCHNCRGCYYACQYTAPHEFDLNVPKVLAEVRQDSWQQHAFPTAFSTRFHRNGVAIALSVIVAITFILLVMQDAVTSDSEINFYSLLPHNLLVAIFAPVFIVPLVVVGLSVQNYWRAIGGEKLTFAQVREALISAGKMKNLAGGHGDGCNFEEEDKFSNARRYYHQATMWGFILCFVATAAATLMHYLFSMHAPYSLLSLPKLLGVSGGGLLSLGSLGLIKLKIKADKRLSDSRVWGGEMAFVVLLFLVSTSGLLLWLLGSTSLLSFMLAFHLGTVFALFLLTPYSKMVHGFFRIAALLRDEQQK